MATQQDGQRKRPSFHHRHSSGSATFPRSPGDGLSSSMQKHKPQRHLVGQGRLVPRIPSHGKNINKLARVAPVRHDSYATSPRNGHIKRNSSDLSRNRDWSTTNLRKNLSETTLHKNRSSGQLTRLGKPAYSKHAVKPSQKRPARHHRSSSTTIHAPQGPLNPTVRFALGNGEEGEVETEPSDEDEDDSAENASWTNESASQSAETSRSNTRPNSITTSPRRSMEVTREDNGLPSPPETPKSSSHQSSQSPGSEKSAHRPKTSDSDSITSRLLKRNTSFTVAPQLSNASSTPFHSEMRPSQSLTHNTLNDNSAPEIVSRFLSAGSSSGPRPSNFLSSAPHSPRESSPTGHSASNTPRRNKSSPNVAAKPLSRTQQKLNLERESVANEPQNGHRPPIGLLRSSRMSNVPLSMHATHMGGDGRTTPQIKQIFDQVDKEYQRTRKFYNPLGDAILRLQDEGIAPKTKLAVKAKPGGSASMLSVSGSAGGDGKYGLSQSLRSQRGTQASSVGIGKKRQVSFQGSKGSKDDAELGSSRSGLDGQDEETGQARAQRDEIRELSRRLWTSEWETETPELQAGGE